MTKTRAAQTLLDAKRKNDWTWREVAEWAGLKNPGAAWNIVHGKRKPSPELNARLGCLPAKKRLVNWYWRERLLRMFVRKLFEKKEIRIGGYIFRVVIDHSLPEDGWRLENKSCETQKG